MSFTEGVRCNGTTTQYPHSNTNKEIIKIKRKFKLPIIVHRSNKNLGYGGVQKFALNYAIKKN